ncbi:uncharacterized protein BDZ99DRAFT_456828 [Mytilinidion resinicola]|uniref:Uncharacterized protein n=1 Tax=Mytilinidion resinicola TaxID=574789 RepID=A0A6A6Z7Q0_9PEZI|nr:uncharacterized protein BDZ99DRAFT_456828 [Mytilinidion resinicola]KAF2817030.1 hypothetical protein BDZ99DRAFT_456828 [Mytilinidion resinicola]
MGDSESTAFLSTRAALSSNPSYNLSTPSQLTPNTRSEAEAALTANSQAQTDSAAPTTPLQDAAARFEALAGTKSEYMAASTDSGVGKTLNEKEAAIDEAKLAYRRTPARTSSSNYAEALVGAGMSPAPHTSTVYEEPGSMSPDSIAAMKGVVPLKTGVGEGQAEAVKRARPAGLKLGDLGRKQSWSPEDFKHVYSERLMVKGNEDPGYSSTVEEG